MIMILADMILFGLIIVPLQYSMDKPLMETLPFTQNLKDPTPSLSFCMDPFTVLPQCSSSHLKATVFKAVAALDATLACFSNRPVCNNGHVAA